MKDVTREKTSDALKYAIIFLSLGLLPFAGAGFDRAITDWVLVISAVLFIVVLLLNKTKPGLSIRSPLTYLLAMVLFAALSIIWSINPFRSTVETLQLTLYLIVFMTVFMSSREKQVMIFKILTVTAAFISLLGIFIYLMVVNGRMEATFGSPTTFATFAAMFFFITFGYYIRKNNRWGGVLSVIFLTCVILTSSRGVYLAALAAFPFVFIGIKKTDWKRVLGTTLLMLLSTAVFTAICMFLAPLIQKGAGLSRNPLELLSRPESFETSTSGRFEFWKVAWDLLWQRPVFGFGQGTFFEAYNISYTGNEWFSRFAHNHYLQMAVETGLLGLALFGGFLVSVFLGVIRKFKELSALPYFFGLVAAAIVFLAHIFVDFSFNYPSVALLFFAVMGVVSSHIGTEKRKTADVLKFIMVPFLILTVIASLMIFRSTRLFDRGLRQEQFGKIDSAIANYEKGIRAFPLNNMGYLFLSGASYTRYMESGNSTDMEKALLNGLKASETAPFNSGHYLWLARMYFREGILDEAVRYYEKTIRYGVYNLDGYIELAILSADNGDTEKAREVLHSAEKLIPYAVKTAGTDSDEVRYKAATVYTYLATIYDDYDDSKTADEYRKKSDEVLDPG